MVEIAGITPGRFLALLKKGKAHNYLFLGEEEFLKDEFIDELLPKVISEHTLPFNYRRFYCDEAGAKDIANALSSSPSMSPYRLVVLKRSDAMDAGLRESIISYLKNSSPTTILIIFSEKLKPSGGLSELAVHMTKISFKKLYEKGQLNWIRARLQRLGKSMSQEVAYELIEYSGSSLRQMDSELEKLSTYTGGRKEINMGDVMELAGKSRAKSAFDLNDAICKSDCSRSLIILSSLLKDGLKPAGVINLLSWQLRRIWAAGNMLSGGASRQKIGSELKIHPYFLGKLLRQVDEFNVGAIKGYFDAILEAESKIKSAPVRQELVIELLVIKLCLLGTQRQFPAEA